MLDFPTKMKENLKPPHHPNCPHTKMPIRAIVLPIYEDLFKLLKQKTRPSAAEPKTGSNDLFYELALKTSIFDRP
jgi:hypothetical protein